MDYGLYPHKRLREITTQYDWEFVYLNNGELIHYADNNVLTGLAVESTWLFMKG